MTESTWQSTPEGPDTGQCEPAGPPPPPSHSNGMARTTLARPLAPDGCSAASPAPRFPAGYLADELADAQRLLTYAAEVGIEVDATIRTAVLTARSTREERWSAQTAAHLLAALTLLAAKLRPVTAESLKVCADPTVVAQTLRGYKIVALCLALFIVPFSLASFVTSGLSEAIRKDLETANKLAVQLHDELGPQHATLAPAPGSTDANTLPHGVTQKEALMDLQQFAALIRTIDARARQLHVFAPYTVEDPLAARRAERDQRKETFELHPGLQDRSAFYAEATAKISVFQEVRYLEYVRDTCKNRSQRGYAAVTKSGLGCNGSGCVVISRKYCPNLLMCSVR